MSSSFSSLLVVFYCFSVVSVLIMPSLAQNNQDDNDLLPVLINGISSADDRLDRSTNQPSYVVVAPKLFRPNSVYRLTVSVPPDSPLHLLQVRASIVIRAGGGGYYQKQQQVTSSQDVIIDTASSDNIIMKVPATVPVLSDNQSYRLKVQGWDISSPDGSLSSKIIFTKETRLNFEPDFLSIIVQTNRKIFRNEMTVRFRVILIQMMDLKPYTDSVTIYVLDPKGFIMRRWPSRYPTTGIVTLSYRLPSFPTEGRWTIRVETHHSASGANNNNNNRQIQDHTILVERYYMLSYFEVIPSAPVYVLDTDESYDAAVTTSFHAGRVAKGNITIRIFAKPINSSDDRFILISEETPPWVHDFVYQVRLQDVKSKRGGAASLVGWVIRVGIILHDYFVGETREGHIDTRIIQAKPICRFAASNAFKPGMPFEGNIYIVYEDNQPLSKEKLEAATLVLRPVITTGSGSVRNLEEIKIPPKGEYITIRSRGGSSYNDDFTAWMERQAEDADYKQFRSTGIHHFRMIMPLDAASMRITAQYRDEAGDDTSAVLQTIAFYTGSNSFYAHISTSTKPRTIIGHNAIFHLRTNFPFSTYSYVIVSKGLVIDGQQLMTTNQPTRLLTFSVPVAVEMAPSFKLVTTVLSPNGQLIADSITIPVNSFNRYKINMTLVQLKDHSKQTVQLVTRTVPGSFVGVSLLRSGNYYYQADSEVTHSRALRSLYELEPFNRSVHRVTWTDRQGLEPDHTQYLIASNPAADTRRTFSLAGLVVFTDASISHKPETDDCVNGYEPCWSSGCYHESQRCDGNKDCTDGYDEEACPDLADDRDAFRIVRKNRYHDFYDWLDGDWAWYDIPTTDDGIEFYDRPVAPTNDVWYLNAFSMHAQLGLAILDQVVEYDGSPPFYFSVESPSSVRRGETVGIRLLAINNLKNHVECLIILEASDDYRFVETGPDGEVEHFKPNLVAGERHHLISVKPESTFEMNMPIAPIIERGSITIQIRALSQIAKQNLEIPLEILPEGATISRHTSLMLDLKDRAHVLRFLDIPVEETPVIPYSKYRRYLYGSPRGQVRLCGDVFGPIFITSSAISTEALLSRSLRGTEANLFNLAATSWNLHYLRLTGQLESETLRYGLNEMNVQLADLMRLYHDQGSFRSQTNSQPSVWVTAWVIRVLGQSQFQDWENHYFVDSRLLTSCVQWILGFQNADGSFNETVDYSNPLDRRPLFNRTSTSSGKVGHTANVLIGLSKCGDSLDGPLKVSVATAKSQSVRYLERVLSGLKDPYEVAIVTHALTLANSAAKETAFGRMHKLKRETDGMVYWSREPVPVNGIVYENQRPFLQPRLPMDQDALAVETSAYALLVYLARDGIGDLQQRIVTWLNTMRMTDGGFVSIYDSLVAMEALTEYAYRARLRDITDMSVLVEASASSASKQVVRIRSDNLAKVHNLEIENVWGHVNVIGRGAGQAVVQLKVQYGVDWEELMDRPRRPYFDLHIEESYSHYKNKSRVDVEACVKWLASDKSPTSGSATLEYELPSGYGLIQSEADQVAKNISIVSDVLAAADRLVWTFDRVTADRFCFHFEVRRWFPVANMTMYRSAIIYESHSPEHFQMRVFNATPLYVLDICEVCGSFQCPYCPHFSSAQSIFRLNDGPNFPVTLVIAAVNIIHFVTKSF